MNHQQAQASVGLNTHSRYSCLTCRHAKRRCDRTYPQCTLCFQRQLTCDYPHGRKRREVRKDGDSSEASSPSRSTAAEGSLISTLKERRDNDRHVLSDSTVPNFTAERFLDPEVFYRARLEIPKAELSITTDIANLVGGVPEIQATSKKFFDTIHTWMPIISRSQFSMNLLNRLSHKRAELYLLTLSMKLCCAQVTPATVKAGLYRVVKQLHFEVEVSGTLSILVLQAAILISLYEMGHAIYPAALLSVGSCARYATALGIDKTIYSKNALRLSWIEEEECRRVWWSILVMDRFLNLCDPQRYLITPDPDLGCYLPVDDEAWDAGISLPEDAMTLGTASSYHMGRFARFAQAAHLLSQVLHRAAEQSTDTAHLRSTIFALVNISQIEAHMRRLEFCTQMAVCYSAVLLLEQPSLFAGGSSNSTPSDCSGEQLSTESVAILQAGSKMSRFLVEDSGSEICDLISPFLLHVIYQIASIHLRTWYTRGDRVGLDETRQSLKILGRRWLAAGTYLSLLDNQEILLDMQLK